MLVCTYQVYIRLVRTDDHGRHMVAASVRAVAEKREQAAAMLQCVYPEPSHPPILLGID